MIDHTQLIIAVVAAIVAGMSFLLIGRRLLAAAPEREDAPPAERLAVQPISAPGKDELSPEAKAFIAALQGRDAPKPETEDPIWSVQIWDDRDHRHGAQGLPH